MQQVHFSYNWNKKLGCRAFTSLRLSGRFNKGDKVEIVLKREVIGQAEVIGKSKLKLADISDFIAYLDTGYDKEKCQDILRKMYKDNTEADWEKQDIYFYLFVMYRRNGVKEID